MEIGWRANDKSQSFAEKLNEACKIAQVKAGLAGLLITRDQDGTLSVHEEEPIRCDTATVWNSGRFESMGQHILENEYLFPEVTWENSPKKLIVQEN